MRFLRSFSVCAFLFGVSGAIACGDDDGGYCGDGECDRPGGESYRECPEDCLPVCGDGVCDSGENSQSCAEDCQTGPVCGDGVCNGNENSSSCPGDCPANSCPDPNYPVDCHDNSGVCWDPGTNCASNWFICGSGLWRCLNTLDSAYCCGNVFITCPAGAGYPYYCPQDGLCYGILPGYCNPNICSLVNGDC